MPLKLSLNQSLIHFKITNVICLLFRLFRLSYTSKEHLLIHIQQFLGGKRTSQTKGSYSSLAVCGPHLWLCRHFWVPEFHKGLLMIEYFQKMQILSVKPGCLMIQNCFCTILSLKSGNSEKGKKAPSLIIPASNWASQWVQSLAIFRSPFLKQWKYVGSYITLVKF